MSKIDKKTLDVELKKYILETIKAESGVLEDCFSIEYNNTNNVGILQLVVYCGGLEEFFLDTAFEAFDRFDLDVKFIDDYSDFIDEYVEDNFEELLQWFIKTTRLEDTFKAISFVKPMC